MSAAVSAAPATLAVPLLRSTCTLLTPSTPARASWTAFSQCAQVIPLTLSSMLIRPTPSAGIVPHPGRGALPAMTAKRWNLIERHHRLITGSLGGVIRVNSDYGPQLGPGLWAASRFLARPNPALMISGPGASPAQGVMMTAEVQPA